MSSLSLVPKLHFLRIEYNNMCIKNTEGLCKSNWDTVQYLENDKGAIVWWDDGNIIDIFTN